MDIYEQIADIEMELENDDISDLRRSTLERRLAFLEKRAVEIEEEEIRAKQEKKRRLAEQKEKERREAQVLGSIQEKNFQIERILAMMDGAISKLSGMSPMRSDAILSDLYHRLIPHRDFINQYISGLMRERAIRLLDAINSNSQFSHSVHSQRENRIASLLSKIFILLGMEPPRVEIEMDTSRDEELARELQRQLSL